MKQIEKTTVDGNEQYCAQQAVKGSDIKFAISDDATARQLTLGAGGVHVDLVPANAEFVGAGSISRREGRRDDDGKLISNEVWYNATWGSDSCEEEFGYDRPSSIEAKKEVLEDVRAAFAGWLNKTLGE